MSELFDDTEIKVITDEINRQLQAIGQVNGVQFKGESDKKNLLESQRKAISEESGEEADSFLKRFARNARKDLCESGGLLFEQWKEVKDLSSKKNDKNVWPGLGGDGAGWPAAADGIGGGMCLCFAYWC